MKYMNVPIIHENELREMHHAYLVVVVVNHWTKIEEVHISRLDSREVAVVEGGPCECDSIKHTPMDTVYNKLLYTKFRWKKNFYVETKKF